MIRWLPFAYAATIPTSQRLGHTYKQKQRQKESGFFHFFKPEIQGLFMELPGPYFKNSRTSK